MSYWTFPGIMISVSGILYSSRFIQLWPAGTFNTEDAQSIFFAQLRMGLSFVDTLNLKDNIPNEIR